MNPRRIRPVVRVVLGLMAVHAMAWGWFAVNDPSLYRSTAYDMLQDLAPIRVWGAIAMAIGLNGLVVVIAKENHITACRITLTLYFAWCVTVAWSIALLTISGEAPGALGGALTWGVLGCVALAMQNERVGIGPPNTAR